MKETVTRAKTYITSLVERLRSLGGSLIWRVTSYWPLIAAVIVGLPLALMPLLFDLAGWTYIFTVPIGVAGGMLAYIGAYSYME